MKIQHQTTHTDGSATFQIDFSDEEQITLVQEGLLSLIRKGIAEVAEYQNAVQPYQKEVQPVAWMVGKHIFTTYISAEAFQARYSHYDIVPLFKHV